MHSALLWSLAPARLCSTPLETALQALPVSTVLLHAKSITYIMTTDLLLKLLLLNTELLKPLQNTVLQWFKGPQGPSKPGTGLLKVIKK